MADERHRNVKFWAQTTGALGLAGAIVGIVLTWTSQSTSAVFGGLSVAFIGGALLIVCAVLSVGAMMLNPPQWYFPSADPIAVVPGPDSRAEAIPPPPGSQPPSA